MEDSGDAPASHPLRGIRIAAAVGVVVAGVAVVFGFTLGLVPGLLALFALPVVPLLFVLGFEAVKGSPS